jgi:hypothetical protein
MGEKYLAYLQDEAKTCEAKRRWEPCIEHSEKFISAYQGLDLSQKAIALKAQLMDKRDYLQLRSDADNAGTDYQKAYRLYRDYLRDHPRSTQKEAIEKEIAALGQQLKAQQTWLGVKAFATNTNKGVYERIQKLDQYLRKNLSSAYASDARDLMDRLERERQESLRQNQILAQRRAEQARIERERKERDETQPSHSGVDVRPRKATELFDPLRCQRRRDLHRPHHRAHVDPSGQLAGAGRLHHLRRCPGLCPETSYRRLRGLANAFRQ